MSAAIEQRNQDATAYCGNLDEKVSEELLWELMIQAGPVVNVHMPRDKVTNAHQGYGFVEFRSEEDADYAIKIMNMIQLYGKHIRVNKASQDKKNLDVGANLFIGNLDPDVDEKLLYDTFSAFGGIVQTPKIMRDPDTGTSKGYGFIGFDSFEAADLAIECMNSQYLSNRAIVVQYAFKKDSKGERHGSQAERLLASSNPNKTKPHQLFASIPPQATGMAMVPPMQPSHHMVMHGMNPNPMMSSVPPPPPPPPMMMQQQVMMGVSAPPPPAPPMMGGIMPNPPINQLYPGYG